MAACAAAGACPHEERNRRERQTDRPANRPEGRPDPASRHRSSLPRSRAFHFRSSRVRPQQSLSLRPPWHGEALHERHRQVERESEDAGDEDGRPRLAGLEKARRALDVDAQRLRRAAEELAHDGADHGQRRAGPEGGEHEGRAVRQPQLPEDLPLAGRAAPHELEAPGVHAEEPSQGADEGREEGHEGRDGDLRARADPEPDDRERRQRDDRAPRPRRWRRAGARSATAGERLASAAPTRASPQPSA